MPASRALRAPKSTAQADFWNPTPWGDCVLLPAHDEIVAMVPEHDGSAATAALVECMTTEFQGVPIAVKADEPKHAWEDAA